MNKYWKGATEEIPEPAEYREVPYHEHVKFVCRCGGDEFRVYKLHADYKTYAECVSCGLCNPDYGDEGPSTVVHSG